MTIMNYFSQFYSDVNATFANYGMSFDTMPTYTGFTAGDYSTNIPVYSGNPFGDCSTWQSSTTNCNTFNLFNYNTPIYNLSFNSFSTPAIWNSGGVADTFYSTGGSRVGTSGSTSSYSSSRGVCNYKYAKLSRSVALTEAAKNPNLEKLTGGNGWSVSNNSFANDIPYARKGTSKILAKVAAQIGQNITITSALGTMTSPHVKSTGYASHYNESNPKLDIGGGLTNSQALALKDKLLATGYFSRVSVESDGATSHLDVQIKESAYTSLA